MGKGDIRTRKGKIWRGTCGVTRSRKHKNRKPRPFIAIRKIKDLKSLETVMAETTSQNDIKNVTETVYAEVETTKKEVVETQQQAVTQKEPVAEVTPATTTEIIAESLPSKKSKTKTPRAEKKTKTPKPPKESKEKTPAAKKSVGRKKKTDLPLSEIKIAE